jgi:hypothetical protein
MKKYLFCILLIITLLFSGCVTTSTGSTESSNTKSAEKERIQSFSNKLFADLSLASKEVTGKWNYHDYYPDGENNWFDCGDYTYEVAKILAAKQYNVVNVLLTSTNDYKPWDQAWLKLTFNDGPGNMPDGPETRHSIAGVLYENYLFPFDVQYFEPKSNNPINARSVFRYGINQIRKAGWVGTTAWTTKWPDIVKGNFEKLDLSKVSFFY